MWWGCCSWGQFLWLFSIRFFFHGYARGGFSCFRLLGCCSALGLRQIFVHVDPDEPPAEGTKKVGNFRPFTAFWVGFTPSTLGLKSLGIYVACVSIITTAGLGAIEQGLSFLIVVLIIISTML